MNITLNNTGLTLTDGEMVELRKFAVLHNLSGKFYLAVDEDGTIDCFEDCPYVNSYYWDKSSSSDFCTIREGSESGVEYKAWDESLTIVNVNQLLRGFDVSECEMRDVEEPTETIKPKQADFFDELADLLAKHSASIASSGVLSIQVKGRTFNHKGRMDKWYGRELIEGNCISARTIRKFRLRSKVV